MTLLSYLGVVPAVIAAVALAALAYMGLKSLFTSVKYKDDDHAPVA